jgi:hypothetical protein
MKKILTALFFTASFSAFAQTDLPVDSLSWFSGCWLLEESNGRVTTECWMKPQGGVMLGISQAVKNGKTTSTEFIRIQKNTDGKLQYIANPSGQKETPFTMISFSKNEVLFENPEHDFPQKIRYKKLPDGSLVASIEGKINGKEKIITYPYKRSDW